MKYADKPITMLAAIVVLMIMSVLARADAPEKLSLTLKDAEALAFANNPMYLASLSGADAAAARHDMAAARRRPSISTTAFLTKGDMNGILSGPASVMPSAVTSYQADRFYDQNVMLMAPLDFSGGLKTSIRAAGLRGEAEERNAERARQDLILQVRMMYYDALFFAQRAGAWASAVKMAEEQLKNDEAALTAGKVPAFYIDRDRAELAMSTQMLAESEREAGQTLIRLAAMLGLDPATPLELTDALTAPTDDFTGGATPNATPDTEAAHAEAEAAEAGLSSAKRAFAPEVSLTLMSDRFSARNMDTMEGTTAAVIVTLPVWDGGMRRAAVREARAMSEMKRQDLRETELRVSAEYRSIMLEYETALKNIATAGTALKSAQTNYDVAKLRYDAGKGILVEMLDAVAALTRAKVGRAQALKEALTARDMLLRLEGKL